jgi:hypothetical protein
VAEAEGRVPQHSVAEGMWGCLEHFQAGEAQVGHHAADVELALGCCLAECEVAAQDNVWVLVVANVVAVEEDM